MVCVYKEGKGMGVIPPPMQPPPHHSCYDHQLPPSPPPHTHDRESEGGKEAQRRTGAKITAAKTTRCNFTDAIRDDVKG